MVLPFGLSVSIEVSLSLCHVAADDPTVVEEPGRAAAHEVRLGHVVARRVEVAGVADLDLQRQHGVGRELVVGARVGVRVRVALAVVAPLGRVPTGERRGEGRRLLALGQVARRRPTAGSRRVARPAACSALAVSVEVGEQVVRRRARVVAVGAGAALLDERDAGVGDPSDRHARRAAGHHGGVVGRARCRCRWPASSGPDRRCRARRSRRRPRAGSSRPRRAPRPPGRPG